jgi:hypothetical protein
MFSNKFELRSISLESRLQTKSASTFKTGIIIIISTNKNVSSRNENFKRTTDATKAVVDVLGGSIVYVNLTKLFSIVEELEEV